MNMLKLIGASVVARTLADKSETLTTWHMFPPQFTGLADKDAGDFRGEVGFIWFAFELNNNPEEKIAENIFEMSEVNVTGWGNYVACNAPGTMSGPKQWHCPATEKEYCCTDNATSHQRPGKKPFGGPPGTELGNGGTWYSFPKASQGVTWTEKVLRRIKSSCLAEVWRADAGGCPKCGPAVNSSCVANCIKSTLAPRHPAIIGKHNITALNSSFHRAFANRTLCPDQPLPTSTFLV
jgi:hypothetical protein